MSSDDLTALLQRSLDLARAGELRGAARALLTPDSCLLTPRRRRSRRAWPTLPDRLFGAPDDPCERRPKQADPALRRCDPARLAAEIARERWWGIDPEREVWRFCEIRRRARRQRRGSA